MIQKRKQISFEQNKRYNSFFFHELELTTALLLILDSYLCWSTQPISLKVCGGFYIFDSVSILLTFVFLFNKKHGLFDFKTS